jgi:hypothetical protein
LTQIRDRVHFAAGHRLRDALPRYGGREARGRAKGAMHCFVTQRVSPAGSQ